MRLSTLLRPVFLAAAAAWAAALSESPEARAEDGAAAAVPRIIGGAPVSDNSLGFTARIIARSFFDTSLCTGSLIAPNVVLTAAHCLTYEGGIKFFGVPLSITFGYSSTSPGQTYNSTKYYIHRGYDMELAHHDIGVIILPTNVPADVATPVKIYTGGYNEETVFTVAGYGVTKDGSTKLADDLMQAELKIGDKVFCEHSDPMWDIATQICLARNDGRDTCVGDSGGPAVVHDKDGKIALLGITSFGAGAQLRNPKCGADNVAGYYTDASKYISWIASATDLRAAKFTTANSTGNSATRPYNGDTTNNYFSQYMELLEASSLEYLDVEETNTASVPSRAPVVDGANIGHSLLPSLGTGVGLAVVSLLSVVV